MMPSGGDYPEKVRPDQRVMSGFDIGHIRGRADYAASHGQGLLEHVLDR